MMDFMDDLVQFLRDRYDEDDAAARAASLRAPVWPTGGTLFLDGIEHNVVGDEEAFCHPHNVDHIARHDPDRVLREVDAKRQLLDRYAEVASNDIDEPYEYAYGWANGLGIAVRMLALPCADHPDYREAWRP